MDETPKQVVERFYSGLAAGEMNFDLLDEELEWITPASLPWTPEDAVEDLGTIRYRGLGEFGAYLQSLLGAVDGMRAVVSEVVEVEDGRILALGEEIGRSTTTGEEFRAPFAHLLTVADGKITRLRGHVDTAAMQRACRAS